jgi:hypothetical protein
VKITFLKKIDRYSAGLDEAFTSKNFTSSQGNGLGYLGCVTADTISFHIYEEMISAFNLINGQK